MANKKSGKSTLKQLTTALGGLDMVEVAKGVVPVDCVRIYRHSGDHTAGIQDSWYVNVTARLTGLGGCTVYEGFTLKIMLEHGKPMQFCGNVAKNVLMKGEIDLKYWKSDTPRD
jgi:hypothetical protein